MPIQYFSFPLTLDTAHLKERLLETRWRPASGPSTLASPEDKEGVTAVSRPVSVLRPSMVSRLSEDSGSRASDRLLEYDILVE